MTSRPPRSGLHKRMMRAGLALLAALRGDARDGLRLAGPPGLVASGELAEARTFPYYRIYWVGRHFDGLPLAAVDGRKGYNKEIGDSVYYGNCVQGKNVFGSGSCRLPLQVTTSIYRLHDNGALGAQHNVLIRGVPAAVYDEGRTIELYSGRLAIDVYSDTPAHALAGARLLRPLNASGSAAEPLPAPVFCPGLAGPQEAALERAMRHLPGPRLPARCGVGGVRSPPRHRTPVALARLGHVAPMLHPPSLDSG